MSSPDTPNSPHKQIFSHDVEEKLDIVEYWRSITKRKWAILALGLAVAMVAAVIMSTTIPIYRSTATILIELPKSKPLTVDDIYNDIPQYREHFQTQVEMLKSR